MRPWLIRQEAATSILVYGELIEYLKGFPDFSARRLNLARLLRGVPPYRLSRPIMERHADIRRALRPPQGPGLIGDMDTLIAATAMELGLTLVTTDSDFQRVPGLDVMLIPRFA